MRRNNVKLRGLPTAAFFFACCLASPSGSVEPSSGCFYEGIAQAHQLASGMREPESFEDRVLVALDALIDQAAARRLLSCAARMSNAQSAVEELTGPIQFGENVYQIRQNDYSYGVVGFSARSDNFYAAKMTAKVDANGNVRPYALFVMAQTPQERKWLRHENGSFRRDDAYCLSCHSSRATQNYRFDIREYHAVP